MIDQNPDNVVAQNSTIYKLRIALSDLERNYYDSVKLTVALHPSETPERLIARVLAYCINASPELVFTKGLCQAEEPDLWIRHYDDNTPLWIEVGEPAPERVKKAVRRAEQVKIYSFNSKSETWWQQSKSKLGLLDASIYQFETDQVEACAKLLNRSNEFAITISGTSAYLASGEQQQEIAWKILQEKN